MSVPDLLDGRCCCPPSALVSEVDPGTDAAAECAAPVGVTDRVTATSRALPAPASEADPAAVDSPSALASGADPVAVGSVGSVTTYAAPSSTPE